MFSKEDDEWKSKLYNKLKEIRKSFRSIFEAENDKMEMIICREKLRKYFAFHAERLHKEGGILNEFGPLQEEIIESLYLTASGDKKHMSFLFRALSSSCRICLVCPSKRQCIESIKNASGKSISLRIADLFLTPKTGSPRTSVNSAW